MLWCLLAYPALVHLSVLTGSSALAGLALVALCAGLLFPALRARRGWAWAGLLAAAVASGLLVALDATRHALALPPVVMPLMMAAWWAPTLRAGRTPFVTQVARALRGPLSPEHAAYTRGVTVLWVAVFLGLALVGAATALWGSPELWSVLTNFGSPALIGGVFAIEYAVRRWRLRHEAHPDFLTFLKQLARAGMRPGLS